MFVAMYNTVQSNLCKVYIVPCARMCYSNIRGGMTMAIPESRRRANDRYNAKCAQLNIKPLRDEAEQIKHAATEAGQSTQSYILDAVRARMDDSVIRIAVPREQIAPLADAAGKTPKQWLIDAINRAIQ